MRARGMSSPISRMQAQLDKYDPTKHLLKVDDKTGVKVVSKRGIYGAINRLHRALDPKAFNVEKVARRMLTVAYSNPMKFKDALQSDSFQKFREKCEKKDTKAHKVAAALLTLDSEIPSTPRALLFRQALKAYTEKSVSYLGDSKDLESFTVFSRKINGKPIDLMGPTTSKLQAVVNVITSEKTSILKRVKTKPEAYTKIAERTIEVIECASKMNASTMNVETFRQQLFTELNAPCVCY